MSYYVISVGVALASGVCVRIRKRRNKELNLAFAFYLAAAVFAVSIMLAVPISLYVDGGVPSDYWGSRLYFFLLENYVGRIISTAVSTSLIKLSDVIVTIAIVMTAYSVTPIKYKHEKYLIY
jgi:hypothetical protein